MGYATVSEIQAEFKDIKFSVSTSVTTADVERFILEAEAEINMRLSGRYIIPITGPAALPVLRMIEIWLVKARVQSITRVQSQNAPTNQGGGDTDLRAQALAFLKDLANGVVWLMDAPGLSNHGGVRSFSADNNIPHIFLRDKVQW